jgi:hypothetical protein
MLTCDRNSIEYEGFIFTKILDFPSFSDFDCGQDDLNGFIREDAVKHHTELIAETYSFSHKSDDGMCLPMAFVSLSNDAIRRENLTRPVLKKIPRGLRYEALPAVKIGRLGVWKEFHGLDVGTALINLLKKLFTTENRTGCRFITVDAYNDPRVLNFYQKMVSIFTSKRMWTMKRGLCFLI